jgi:succinyl-diaminopimelate desuccinylase
MTFDHLQNQLETTLTHLVRIPSVSSDPQACREIIDFIRDEISSYDLHIQGDFTADNPWLLATTQNTNEPDILLAAHLDVVPAANYDLVKKDGNLYGRGVYDMKFAAACYLQFLRLHAEDLSNMNIGVLFTTDEEQSSLSMPSVMATGLRPKVVFLPDGGDDWMVERRAKGFHHVRLAVGGTTAHGSRPWEGKNALHHLIDILNQLRETYPSTSKDSSTLAVTRIGGGQAINQIPADAWADIDFRSFSQQDMDAYKAQLAALTQRYDLTVTTVNSHHSVIFDNTSPVVQPFLAALRQHLGTQDIPYCDAYGGTDARFFAQYDIPSIIIEPHGGGRHADTEWLKADDLGRFYQLIENWLTTSSN